jgi:type IV pilus assembly protein PilB
MVICAGPTGAGKTTTLYASLLEVNNDGTNVTTVEDPSSTSSRHQPDPDQRAGRSTFATA